MCISIGVLFPAFIEPCSERFKVWSNIVHGRAAAAAAAVAGEEEDGGDDADDGGTSYGDADDLRCGIS